MTVVFNVLLSEMLAKWESNPQASTQIPIFCNVFSEELSVITVIGYVTMAAGPDRLGPAHSPLSLQVHSIQFHCQFFLFTCGPQATFDQVIKSRIQEAQATALNSAIETNALAKSEQHPRSAASWIIDASQPP
jgi:hypothetical protein